MANYEVFISFKNMDGNGLSTRDAIMAERLYRTLRERGIQTFFSKYSIDESARSDYVDAIDEALESAQLLVAVGTSKKNLTSRWVKAEINQFRTLLNSDEEGRRSVISFRSQDYPESELPSSLKPYQSFNDLNAVVKFIENFLKKDSAFQDAEEDTAPEESGPQIGGLLANRYKLLSLVGRGGFSSVYYAIDEKSNMTYAVKQLHLDQLADSSLALDAFRTEADLLRLLNHPAIPKIYDIIETPDSMILVMNFIQGDSLQKLLSHGPMHERTVIDIARQLADVLDYLHSRHDPVIFRDMKPANIILHRNGKVNLLDFGIARTYKPSRTEDTTCLGTIGYAAPEQFGGMGQSDARTDIYGLGVTLYHLLTGKNPAEPPYEILPIRSVDPNLSRGMEAIILKCTQREPALRFQSAKELLEALEDPEKFRKQTSLRRMFLPPVRKKPAKKKKTPVPVPTPKLPTPTRSDFVFHTTVLSGEAAEPVKPMPAPTGGFAVPGVPVFVPPKSVSGTAPLSSPETGALIPVSPQKSPHSELDPVLQKLAALDPESLRIVCDLIDHLSK